MVREESWANTQPGRCMTVADTDREPEAVNVDNRYV